MNSHLICGAHIHANGIRQHYLRYGGKGQPLILVPGITSPAITWGFVAEALAANLDVYVLDVRGRGLSEAGNHLDYGIDACARDVVEFAQALSLENAVLLGHSMGARHAVRACVIDARRFARAILVDPPMSGPGRRAYPANLAWYVEAMMLARRGGSVEMLRRFTPTWTDAQIALRAEWLHTCEPAAVLTSYAGFHGDDMHADLPRLTLPTLLVTAERGDVVREEDVAACRALQPTLQSVRVADAGHMIPWDNLVGFLAAIGPFLAQTKPSAAGVGDAR